MKLSQIARSKGCMELRIPELLNVDKVLPFFHAKSYSYYINLIQYLHYEVLDTYITRMLKGVL